MSIVEIMAVKRFLLCACYVCDWDYGYNIHFIISLCGYMSGLMFLDKEPKMNRIRKYLIELVDRGELDLSKPIPNVKVREIAEALREKYGENFNVNTISSVIRELRVHSELDNGGSESELDYESKSELEPESGKGESKGGGAWKIVVGVIVGIVVVGVVGFMLLAGRVGLFFGKKKQGVNTNVNSIS